MMKDSVGALIWVPHEELVWQQAEVVGKLSSTQVQVQYLEQSPMGILQKNPTVHDVNTEQVAKLAGEGSISAVPLCNSFEQNGVEDMCTLNHLHEPAVLQNLQVRHSSQLPYTYTGQICIAVNPYQWLDLYNPNLYQIYLTQPSQSLPPHPFALSAKAYTDMCAKHQDQSILVSGESGAGKTETVKIMMNHLASISGGSEEGSSIIEKVLQSNPLLESFGNAKTLRNDNSSRFGKFAQLQFDVTGCLIGAKCETYLLEKNRVINRIGHEKNYHIFHQLFTLPNELLQKYSIQAGEQCFRIVASSTASKDYTSSGDIDINLKATRKAMQTIGIASEEEDSIFALIATILHLCEIDFQTTTTIATGSSTNANVTSENGKVILQTVATLFNISIHDLEKALCERSMVAGSESYTIPLNAEQAADLRDAFAKGIYALLFDWLVMRINKAICAKTSTNMQVVKNYIGLLDIFGFESFDANSFEQLCINYANEKLQYKFNNDVFQTVQEEYISENIPLALVTFQDNQCILDLIENKMGIIDILNEEVLRPSATDQSFVSKVLDTHQTHSNLSRSKFDCMSFTIQHYAGAVTYCGNYFLEKNKDTLPTELMRLVHSSSNKVISAMFPVAPPLKRRNLNTHKRNRGGYLIGNTIAGQFRTQLNELLQMVNATSTQYVRCIKPNATKSPHEFDRQMIVSQLRYAGVIAAIQISRAAFPNRFNCVEFYARFQKLGARRHLVNHTEVIVVNEKSIFDLLQYLLQYPVASLNSSAVLNKPFSLRDEEKVKHTIQLEQNEIFAIGKSKIYFSSGVLEYLEQLRLVLFSTYIVRIQSQGRTYLQRKHFLLQRASTVRLQSKWKQFTCKKRFVTTRKQVIKIQSKYRSYTQRLQYLKQLEIVVAEKKAKEIAAGAELEQNLAKQQAEAKKLTTKTSTSNDDDDSLMKDITSYSAMKNVTSVRNTIEIEEGYDSITKLSATFNLDVAALVIQVESAARLAQNAAAAAIAYREQLQAENDELRSQLDESIHTFGNRILHQENIALKQQLKTLQAEYSRSQELSLISASIVDTRITTRDGEQFVEYKLRVNTDLRGSLYVWNRHSTFRKLADSLQERNSSSKIPELPSKHLFGNLSDRIIQERVVKLNEFLEAATNSDHLQWGFQIDENTCVYKRRNKTQRLQADRALPKLGASSSNLSHVSSSSPRTHRKSISGLFSTFRSNSIKQN